MIEVALAKAAGLKVTNAPAYSPMISSWNGIDANSSGCAERAFDQRVAQHDFGGGGLRHEKFIQ